ncbi:MAG: flagellar filament capping protein FliD [Phycisphaerae bacterium]|jgi:flagellar hook-associated protein 2
MGTINLPGLATGIDTATLIQQLMTINSRRLANYQLQKKKYESENTVLDQLTTNIKNLKQAAYNLSDSSNLDMYTTSTSDKDILTLSASSNARAGSHTVDVNQLATAETWIHDNTSFSYETDYVGGGNFIYSYNHQERVITTVANETTLEDLVGLINNDDNNPGVTASLLYHGGKYHLMLSGQDTGDDYRISVNTSSTEVWKPDTGESYHTFTDDGANASLSTKITALDSFSGTLAGDEKITISGKNHSGTDLSPDYELNITANTTVGHVIDSINEHFDGVATAKLVNGQIWLTDHILGTSSMEIDLDWSGTATLGLPTMAVSTIGGTTGATLSGFEASTFTKTQNAQSSQIKIDGYPSTTAQELQTLTTDAAATSGTFTLSFNGETTAALDYNASIEDIQSALNGLSTVSAIGGVTVTGNDLTDVGGADIDIQFLASAGNVKMISINKGTLAGPSTFEIAEDTRGNNGWIQKNSNTISNALTGITLNLHDVTETGSPIQITVNKDFASISNKIQSVTHYYNELITFLKTNAAYDDSTKKLGLLAGNVAATFIKDQVKRPFTGIVDGFVDSIDSYLQASDIGITFDGNNLMKFDESELLNAVEEDFDDVLDLLGATKTGNSNSNVVKFYGSSDTYTTPGTYHVKVTVSGNTITEAKIKLSTESTYRDATWSNNIITGDSTFDSNGNPVYAENNLQFTVDLDTDGTYGTNENPILVHVKQGFCGALEDMLAKILEPNNSIELSKDTLDDAIEKMDTRIRNEQTRLEKEEQRLVEKYARLEKTLALIQQQMGAVSAMSA